MHSRLSLTLRNIYSSWLFFLHTIYISPYALSVIWSVGFSRAKDYIWNRDCVFLNLVTPSQMIIPWLANSFCFPTKLWFSVFPAREEMQEIKKNKKKLKSRLGDKVNINFSESFNPCLHCYNYWLPGIVYRAKAALSCWMMKVCCLGCITVLPVITDTWKTSYPQEDHWTQDTVIST